MVEFFLFRTPILSVSGVQTADDIGVYWDEDCSLKVESIDWGVLSLGEVRKIVVCVRNEGNESFLLVLRQANWNPENASVYLTFSWSCDDQKVGIGENVMVSLSLHVSFRAREISAFSFDIKFMPACPDVDRNGEVDITDIFAIALSYGSHYGEPKYNPNLDVNCDGKIDITDILAAVLNYGWQ
jgi:hypothetical protein